MKRLAAAFALGCLCAGIAERSVAQDLPAGDPDAGSPAPPGLFVVDEDAAIRALESALVQADALLLGPREVEVGLEFDVAVDAVRTPFILSATDENGESVPALGSASFESRTYVAALELQLGLPGDLQIGMSLPVGRRESREDVVFDGGTIDSFASESNGTGDLSLSLQKTLARERGARPDIILSLNVETASGSSNSVFADGSTAWSARLGFTKREDPFVFTSSLSYTGVIDGPRQDSAVDGLGVLGLGAYLAASPRTSLQLVFQGALLASADDGQGGRVDSRVSGDLSLGITSVVGLRSALNVAVGVGLTDEATDFSLGLGWTRSFRPR